MYTVQTVQFLFFAQNQKDPGETQLKLDGIHLDFSEMYDMKLSSSSLKKVAEYEELLI